MFYTGIITTLLPYILLIGVFATLLWNNTFHSQNTQEEPACTQNYNQPATTSYNDGNTCSFDNYSQDNHPGKTKKHTPPACHGRLQPLKTESIISWLPTHHNGTRHKQEGLNQTFTFRGPPMLS